MIKLWQKKNNTYINVFMTSCTVAALILQQKILPPDEITPDFRDIILHYAQEFKFVA